MKKQPLHDVSRRVLAFMQKELKGPITNILVLSQTLAAGRVPRISVREYARMTQFEAARLERLIEEMAVFLRPEPADGVRSAVDGLRTRQRGRVASRRSHRSAKGIQRSGG